MIADCTLDTRRPMCIHQGHVAACADKMSNVICLQHAAKQIADPSVLPVWLRTIFCKVTYDCTDTPIWPARPAYPFARFSPRTNCHCLPCRASRCLPRNSMQETTAHRVGTVDHAAHGALHLLGPSGVQQQHPAGWAAADQLCHVAACTASARATENSQRQVSITQSNIREGMHAIEARGSRVVLGTLTSCWWHRCNVAASCAAHILRSLRYCRHSLSGKQDSRPSALVTTAQTSCLAHLGEHEQGIAPATDYLTLPGCCKRRYGYVRSQSSSRDDAAQRPIQVLALLYDDK